MDLFVKNQDESRLKSQRTFECRPEVTFGRSWRRILIEQVDMNKFRKSIFVLWFLNFLFLVIFHFLKNDFPLEVFWIFNGFTSLAVLIFCLAFIEGKVLLLNKAETLWRTSWLYKYTPLISLSFLKFMWNQRGCSCKLIPFEMISLFFWSYLVFALNCVSALLVANFSDRV